MIKKIHITIILLVLLTIPLATSAKSFHPEANPTLEKDLFWTSSYFKKNSNAGVMTFRVWFKHPANKVWQTLTDTASFKDKMNNYSEAKTLSHVLFKKIVSANPQTYQETENIIGSNKLTSDHNRRKHKNWTDYIYFRFNFPWPLTDRWAVQKVKCNETNWRQHEYKLDYKTYVGNFVTLFGYWELVPVKGHPGWTEFRGRYESDAGISIPKFLSKKAMRSGLKKDVEEYRKILSR
jgi:hypothetical protein